MDKYKKAHDIIAKNIKGAMKERGLKSKYVAEKIGWDEMKISNLLNGRKTIKSEYMPYIANAIGCDLNELFKDVL